MANAIEWRTASHKPVNGTGTSNPGQASQLAILKRHHRTRGRCRRRAGRTRCDRPAAMFIAGRGTAMGTEAAACPRKFGLASREPSDPSRGSPQPPTKPSEKRTSICRSPSILAGAFATCAGSTAAIRKGKKSVIEINPSPASARHHIAGQPTPYSCFRGSTRLSENVSADEGSHSFRLKPFTQSGICRTSSEFRSINAQNSWWLIGRRVSSLSKNFTSIVESSPLPWQGVPAVARSNLSVQRVAPSTSPGSTRIQSRIKVST